MLGYRGAVDSAFVERGQEGNHGDCKMVGKLR
jgi:hypothetical protein